MKICIEKTPDGQFLVYQENEMMAAGMESQQAEGAEQQNKQPARSLQDALMMAGKMLSQQEASNGAPSPFDEGMKKVLPMRGGMGGQGMM